MKKTITTLAAPEGGHAMKDHTATLAGLFIGAAAVGIPIGVRAARWWRCDRLRTERNARA